ncbi:MAG: MG2 domain-containing protein [Magnetococcus sp. MYC-9]
MGTTVVVCVKGRSFCARRGGVATGGGGYVRVLAWVLALIGVLLSGRAYSQATPSQTAKVLSFTPQGVVKAVRQVAVRFSEPMVAMGTPSQTAPFAVECPERGQGVWSDSRNWVYNFDHTLPAGISCSFTHSPDLKALDGAPVEGPTRYSFSVEAPSVILSLPTGLLSEEQIFILGLNAPVDGSSIPGNLHCDIEGVGEKVGMRLLTGQERWEALRHAHPSLLDSHPSLLDIYLTGNADKGWGRMHRNRLPGQGSYVEKLAAMIDLPDSPIIVAQCQRALPGGGKVGVVWGKGIRSSGGTVSSQVQRINFQVRKPFSAELNCVRHSKNAHCVPILPMTLHLSDAIAVEDVGRILLRGKDGSVHAAIPDQEASLEGEDADKEGDKPRLRAWVHDLRIPGPFPEMSDFTLEIPAGLRDRQGRLLTGQQPHIQFVKTDRIPSLAKFAGDFGIIEAKGDATLPVTIRDLEAVLPLDAEHPGSVEAEEGGAPVADGDGGSLVSRWQEPSAAPVELRGRRLRVESTVAFLDWMRRVGVAKGVSTGADSGEADEGTEKKGSKRPGESSVFAHLPPGDASLETFVVPKPGGRKAFEVVGIPFQKPGLYVVELASDRLGAELHGEKKSYHVQTAVVVTNLAPHFKQGRDSSLVWVTTLDQGKPVANAEVTVSDCQGEPLFAGRTDAQGVLSIDQALPHPRDLPACHSRHQSGYLVTVRDGEDISFLLSFWQDGIAPFDFNLPVRYGPTPAALLSTVLDRSLLRAGEHLSMKHVARQSVESGMAYLETERLPKTGRIRHTGSGQSYPFSLAWDAAQTAENSWEIPKEAKLGQYQVLHAMPGTSPVEEVVTGQFWVEAFRMPTLRASINPVQPEEIAPRQMAFDLQVSHLSGGSVGAVPVKLRGMLRQKTLSFEGYDTFEFANGRVKEGEQEALLNPWERMETVNGGHERAPHQPRKPLSLPVQSLTLSPAGSLRAVLQGLEPADTPQELLAELEYQDANGETLTSASRLTLLPSQVILGLDPEHGSSHHGELKLQIVALDRQGQPQAKVPVTVQLLEYKYYTHRKRLLGGFYSYEHRSRITPLQEFCRGVTDDRGRLRCTGKSPVDGQVLLQAQAMDAQQRPSFAHVSTWVSRNDRWWFDVEPNNRMDLLPEKSRLEPGEEAVLQVRMPFPEATVLVTVEREGVMERFVRSLRGDNPTLRIPMQGRYAPNVFVSALAVRGRSGESVPTAMVDLGKPAFRIGYTQLKVGWQAHTLKVQVTTDRPIYKVREAALATIQVTPPAGEPLPEDAEVALAAVDEGLLELRANDSWNLLAAMMQPRTIDVETSTALGRVIGRRHYGLKSVTHGGGGGRMPAGRQLLKPLLLWQGRVKLDSQGRAQLTIPLNDALSSFRVVAVAHAGEDLFGSGSTSFRTSQELALHAGLPPLVREQDRFRAGFTLRNGGERPLQVTVNATLKVQPRGAPDGPSTPYPLVPITRSLMPGEGQEVAWDTAVPANSQRLSWELHATAAGAEDRLLVEQQVLPALAVQVVQSTVSALDKPLEIPVERPATALVDQGGLRVLLQDRLVGALDGVREYLSAYPYTCLEQRVSKAIVLQDKAAWQTLMRGLPAFLDGDGFAKYFPTSSQGSELLTAYVLSIADENGWSVPEESRQKMVNALSDFVKGKLLRPSIPTAPVSNLMLRKLAALEALSRHQTIPFELLATIPLEPNLWPTSAVIDWMSLLHRVTWPTKATLIRQASDVLRARLAFQGSLLSFSSRDGEPLWWMMVSEDSNANRLLLSLLGEKPWQEDLPRLARGALARQVRGHWATTTANAWGVVAMKKFSERFEAVPVRGKTEGQLAGSGRQQDWTRQPQGGTLDFPWPVGQERLTLRHQGQGAPWVTVQSRAAIPLTKPLFNGYRMRRSVTAVERKVDGVWSRGDLLRVKLEIDAQTDRSWVVVNDPIPAGSSILGSGSGKDSGIVTQSGAPMVGLRPTFEEKGFDALRAYYEWVPKGTWSLEYTLRLNNPGQFRLPSSRVEAMYAPELFGETPLEEISVLP